MKIYERPFVQRLHESLKAHPDLIHVVLGPRQVGKTTGVQQLLNKLPSTETFYYSADGEIQQPSSWILEQWLKVKDKTSELILALDEIQKVENWSEAIKKIWDDERIRSNHSHIKLILTGSSSLYLQKGLSESLTGRYQMHRVTHWDEIESYSSYGLTLEEYLVFGGYPASYKMRKNKIEWLDYIKESIIHPVLGRDILSVARVKSPALFKQCFDLACSYAVREISYTKLLGQLQNRGNVELIKHYLELFEGAFLIKQLFKYSNKRTLSRSSSPKILPYCPALYSVTLDADLNEDDKGHAFELIVGTHLAKLAGELYYWRENQDEVDYVLRFGKKLWAIEVKWGKKQSAQGLEKFKNKFPTAHLFLADRNNYLDIIKKIKTEL
jgi:hypothetical protein